jgi:Icc protein
MKTIIQLSDCHIVNKGKVKGVDTHERLLNIINQLPKNDGIIITGDLTHNGDHAAYKRFEKLIKTIKSPVFVMSGNHDNPNKLNQVLSDYTKELDLDKWQIIALDSVQKNKISGKIKKTELKLTENKFYLIALHHPPIPMESAWDDKLSLENPKVLWEMTKDKSQIKGVIWGHAHEEKRALQDSIELLSCPSTGFSFTNTKKHGYRKIELNDDGKINTEVVWMT